MSFYMTLPSDSSRTRFPTNRIGNYNTALARQVVLEGQYEVGLSKVLLPAPKRVFTEVQYITYSTLDDKSPLRSKYIGFFPECLGTFSTFKRAQRKREYTQYERLNFFSKEQKIVGIPKVVPEPNDELPFRFLLRNKNVVLQVKKNVSIQFIAAFQMARVFGFDTETVYKSTKEGSAEFTGSTVYTGPNNMYIMYIYCDIVEYGIVGDLLAPCIRCLPIMPTDDAPAVIRFENPHYIPVEKMYLAPFRLRLQMITERKLDSTTALQL